jgi:hypothetical protein
MVLLRIVSLAIVLYEVGEYESVSSKASLGRVVVVILTMVRVWERWFHMRSTCGGNGGSCSSVGSFSSGSVRSVSS